MEDTLTCTCSVIYGGITEHTIGRARNPDCEIHGAPALVRACADIRAVADEREADEREAEEDRARAAERVRLEPRIMAALEQQALCASPIACAVADEWARQKRCAEFDSVARHACAIAYGAEALGHLEALTRESSLRKVRP